MPSPLDLDDGDETGSQAGSESGSSRSLPSVFLEASRNRMSQEKVDECHRALTKFIVKGLHPFSTVEAPAFR